MAAPLAPHLAEELWSRLGKAQLDGLRIKDAIDSYVRAEDPNNFEEVIELAERAGREETSQAWSVKAADIAASGYILDLSNPNRAADAAQRPVKEVLAELVDAEREMLGLLEQLQREVEEFEL